MFRHFYAALCCLLLAGLGSVSAQGVFFSETFTGSIPNTWTNQVVAGNNQPSSRWVYSTAGPQGSFDIDPVASTTGKRRQLRLSSWAHCCHSEFICQMGNIGWVVLMVHRGDSGVHVGGVAKPPSSSRR